MLGWTHSVGEGVLFKIVDVQYAPEERRNVMLMSLDRVGL